MEGLDVREMSFQNVLDTILKPAGVKVGGFPQEMFQDLTEEEAERFTCNICFLIVNECRQCDNKHLFCQTCVFAWTLTYGENSQKCPMCRCDQRDYKPNKDVDGALLDKRVHCQEEGCSFKSPLKIFLMHSHGKLKYSNAHVDLESLRPARPSGARLLVLPSLGGLSGGPSDGSRQMRGTAIRHQLHQGRVMIHQMMTLLHLEIQLRQQSFISYQSAMEPMVRVQRLDEVLALNEQLNEIGTILSALLSTPLGGRASGPGSGRATATSPDRSAAGSSSGALTQRRVLNGMPPLTSRHDDDDDDDDDDSSSESSSSGESLDLPTFGRRTALMDRGRAAYPPSSALDRPPVPSLERTLNEGQAALEQAAERRSATQQILAESSTAERSATPAESAVLRGREPGMTPRVGQLNRARERQRSVLSPPEGDTAAAAASTTTSVLRLSTDGGHSMSSGANSSGRSTEAANSSGGQLPSLAGPVASHSMRSTTDALLANGSSGARQRDQRRSLSRQDTPSPASREPTPPPPPMPQGSLALRQAMEAMTRSRTPSNIVSRLSGTLGSTPSAGQRQRNASEDVGNRAAGDEQTGGADGRSPAPSSRAASALSGSATGRGVSGSASSPVQQGSILPASLYRRRQRAEGNDDDDARDEGAVDASSARRSPSVSRGQNGSIPRDGRSQSIGARRRISAAVPPQSRRQTPARRTTVAPLTNGGVPMARRNAGRPTADGQTPQAGVDVGPSGSSSSRGSRRVPSLTTNRNRVGPSRTGTDSTANLPKLPGGHTRPRRRSEIHQNLLMKK